MTIPGGCIDNPGGSCSFHFEPLTLAEAKRRFQAEASPGICKTGRFSCPFYTWGKGPTLVCVPGLVDDSKSFILLLAALSRHFRCVSYDWPTGETDGAALVQYRHSDFVADLFALLDYVGAKEVFPLGYSFGSTVVLKAMHLQPWRFPRGVLLSGFARRRLAPAEKLLAGLARYWKGPLRNLPLRNWILHTNHGAAFARREREVWDYYYQQSGALPMAALACRALVMNRIDLRELLPSIHQPVLLVCGDNDPLVNKQCEAELMTGLPQVARVELAQCGHMAIFTHPEAVAEVVGEFFSEPAGIAFGQRTMTC